MSVELYSKKQVGVSESVSSLLYGMERRPNVRKNITATKVNDLLSLPSFADSQVQVENRYQEAND